MRILGRIQGIIRRWWQRRTWGWDESEVWSLDVTFCEWIVPRLKLLKATNHGYPTDLTWESWNTILDEMIEGFSIIVEHEGWPIEMYEDGQFDREATDKAVEKVNKAFKLFGEYAGGLWT